MTDLDLLHTPFIRLRRLRFRAAACTLVATLLGSYLIFDRVRVYVSFIAELKEQRAIFETEQSERLQAFEKAAAAAREQATLQKQQRRLVKILRAIGRSRSETAYYTQVRFQVDGWRLAGHASEQADVLSMLSQLRRVRPDDVVTLEHIAAAAGGADPVRQPVGVAFEMAIQPTPELVLEASE